MADSMSLNLLSRILLLQLVLFSLLLQGCATMAQKTANMRNQLASGNYQSALADAKQALQNNPDGVMENMNLGLLYRLSQNYEASNQALEKAKQVIEKLYATSVSEQTGALLLNDELISYQGDRYEQVLIHFYMALNYLELNQLDAARVELLQSQVKLNEWSEPKDDVPVMRYFSGILFEILGEPDAATVSYRKAVDAYKNTQYRHGLSVPLQLKKDLLRSLSAMGMTDELAIYKKQFNLPVPSASLFKTNAELILIIEKGLTPQREQIVFQTWSNELSSVIRVAVPGYPHPSPVLRPSRVQLADNVYTTEMASNIDGMARSSLNENISAITARAIARAVVKKQSERAMAEKSGSLGQIALMAFNMGSEIADTRCWNTLPQQIEIMRVPLEPGKHMLKLQPYPSTGLAASIEIDVKPGERVIVNRRWTSSAGASQYENGRGHINIIPLFPLRIYR